MSPKKKEVPQAPARSCAFIETIYAANRFEKLSDGWIRDHLLLLDWAPSSEGYMTFKAAEKYCQDKGGRLPTIDELRLLIDYKKFKPATFEIFADTKPNWYWTSTPDMDPAWSSYAWCVNFDYGSVNDGHKDDYHCVRPVRASQ